MYRNSAITGGAFNLHGYTQNGRQGREKDVSVSIIRSDFENNTASQTGGAMYIEQHVTSHQSYSGRASYIYTVLNCTFQYNSAKIAQLCIKYLT